MRQLKELFFRAYTPALSEFKLNDPSIQLIIACPNPPLEAVQAGRAIAVPPGRFSVKQVIQQLPANYQPDIVHISARDMHFRPIGLEQFNCPTVMKIGDTFHWQNGALSGIIEYCQALNCDYHWLYQGVQHLHFFVEAGLKNVFWLPGTPAIDHYLPEKPVQKSYDVVFRGSRSDLHFYRSYLLQALNRAEIAIDVASKPYIESLEDYAKSKIVFNCGLNGDLNRRVFETLMAGGFLLTDRLSPQSGLFQLFQEGEHLECYGSEQELIEKINHYLANPEKAEQIATAGQKQLLQNFSQSAMQQRFHHYILNGELESPFRLEHDRRAVHCNLQDNETLNLRIKLYEVIQELHRLNSQISIVYLSDKLKEVLTDLVDLPRLKITCVGEELTEVKNWCKQVDVHNQIVFQDESCEQVAASPFQIVLLEIPRSLSELSKTIKRINLLITEQSLVIFIREPQFIQALIFNFALNFMGFQHLKLSFPSLDWEIGRKACVIYQKTDDRDASSVAGSHLIFNCVSLKAVLASQIRASIAFQAIRKLSRLKKKVLGRFLRSAPSAVRN